MSDHSELVYWSIGLLHEFVIRGTFVNLLIVQHIDIARAELALVPNIVKIMTSFLNAAEDGSIIRIALRTLKFLGHKNGSISFIRGT
jgi:hypothetical protein